VGILLYAFASALVGGQSAIRAGAVIGRLSSSACLENMVAFAGNQIEKGRPAIYHQSATARSSRL